MDAREVEAFIDLHFSDETKLTIDESKAVGVFRGMLWKLQEAERADVERFLTGRTA